MYIVGQEIDSLGTVYHSMHGHAYYALSAWWLSHSLMVWFASFQSYHERYWDSSFLYVHTFILVSMMNLVQLFAVGYELLLPPVCQSVIPGVQGSAAAPQHVHVQRDPHSPCRGSLWREGRHASKSFTKWTWLELHLSGPEDDKLHWGDSSSWPYIV